MRQRLALTPAILTGSLIAANGCLLKSISLVRQSAKHPLGFRPCFGLFGFRFTPCRDAATNRDLPVAIGGRDRTDQNIEVGVSTTADIPQRSTIRASAMWLELRDRTHRFDLWCAGNAAAGKACPQSVDRCLVRFQLAFDHRDQMLDVFILFQSTQLGYFDTLIAQQTREKSFRIRSTIIMFSARSFSLCSSCFASRRSDSGLPVRDTVPLIGRVSTWRLRICRKPSGELLST